MQSVPSLAPAWREKRDPRDRRRQQALELSTQLYRARLADFLRVPDSERSPYAASSTKHWEGAGTALSTISPRGVTRVCKSLPTGATLSGQPARSSALDVHR